MELVRDETFGPRVPVLRVDGLDEAIAVANGTAYGLSSGVVSNDLEAVMRCVRELRCGTVNVSEVPGYRTEVTPFGGVKRLGPRRQGGRDRGDARHGHAEALYAPVVSADRAARLAAERPAGHSLPAALHLDPGVFALELDRIWRRSWLFACHTCELPAPGDWITLSVADDPIAVVCGEDGIVRAFHDVCRHRGARVCGAASGHGRTLVCPYHQWTYDLQGRLRSSRGMDREGLVDPDRLALAPVHLEEVAGLVFIHLGADPEPFDAARRSTP